MVKELKLPVLETCVLLCESLAIIDSVLGTQVEIS